MNSNSNDKELESPVPTNMPTEDQFTLEMEVDQENLIKALKALTEAGVDFKIKKVATKLPVEPAACVPSCWSYRVISTPNNWFNPSPYTWTPWNPPYNPESTGSPPPGYCPSTTGGNGVGGLPSPFGTSATWCGPFPGTCSYTHPHPEDQVSWTQDDLEDAVGSALKEGDFEYMKDVYESAKGYNSNRYEASLLGFSEDDLYGIGIGLEQASEIASRLRDAQELKDSGLSFNEVEEIVEKRSRSREEKYVEKDLYEEKKKKKHKD